MSKLAWLKSRLGAMSAPELLWRLDQKRLELGEKRRFSVKKRAVTEEVFNPSLRALRLDTRALGLSLDNTRYTLADSIHLLGGYDYSTYKRDWHAGFQTSNHWPLVFSYQLDYKHNGERIGDARTNWELNRHFQFAILAKEYRVTGDNRYLHELEELFADWNENNPFLWGLSWTSVMEIGIRSSSWAYTYAFLEGLEGTEMLCEKLRIGILNMADFVSQHYSRYSSANNHLIVEIYSVGQCGFLFHYEPWIRLAIDTVNEQLPRQNFPDGVNREQAVCYQSFCMEALGLFCRLLVKNGRPLPPSWAALLDRMCTYVADCQGTHGEMIAFGDSDNGKVLDLQGDYDHIAYTQGLFSCLLERRFVDIDSPFCENLFWQFSGEELERARRKSLYVPGQYRCYPLGGNSILSSRDGRVLIGIDHAPLGFGSICAHGQADALSFQLFVDGQVLLADPGTYLYHGNLRSRDEYRRTENHNTVCVAGRDQSQMLGPFLWGRKATCTLLEHREEAGGFYLKAAHDGYGEAVTRTFDYDGQNRLTLTDKVPQSPHSACFLAGPGCTIRTEEAAAVITCGASALCLRFLSTEPLHLSVKPRHYSPSYGVEENTSALVADFAGSELRTEIEILPGA